MIVATEAEEAWCPPTFDFSELGRTLLAWWMIWVESQSSRRSMASRVVSVSASSPPLSGGLVMPAAGDRSIVALIVWLPGKTLPQSTETRVTAGPGNLTIPGEDLDQTIFLCMRLYRMQRLLSHRAEVPP